MSTLLNLNKEIYPLSYIELAQAAYKDIADIEILEQDDYWECIFSSCVADERVTTNEFENYCIGLVSSRARL